MNSQRFYPIGTPGTPWSDSDKLRWLHAQRKKRSYQGEVLDQLEQLESDFEILNYGELTYERDRYPLHALKSRAWQSENPSVLITGGVHGYETSGVQGALKFARVHASNYSDRFNFLIAPCISPWGYETVNRWNPHALDPNRSFFVASLAMESTLLIRLLDSQEVTFATHFDLHESTDSDAIEFWPARAARDGTIPEEYEIPDGFFLVGDRSRPTPAFQRAIIERVSEVTHIAPPDSDGKILGETVIQPGAMSLPAGDMHLCMAITNAIFAVTTEVYPDSDRVTPQQCTEAQIIAIAAGLDFMLSSEQ